MANKKQTSIQIRFGFENSGIGLRFGRERSNVTTNGQGNLSLASWWEIIITNQAAIDQTVKLVWDWGAEKSTTTVLVPKKGVSFRDGVTTLYPETVLVGDTNVWVPYGGGLSSGTFTASIGTAKVTTTYGTQLNVVTSDPEPLQREWTETSRVMKSVVHGDMSVSFPSELLHTETTNNVTTGQTQIKTMKLKVNSPLFPEVKDRLGSQFAETAIFTESSRTEREITIADGIKAKVMDEVTLRSQDNTMAIKLRFSTA